MPRRALASGDVVSVRVFDRENGWEWETVRVVSPTYSDAFGPSFTGEFLTGRFAGKTLALQLAHVRVIGDSY